MNTVAACLNHVWQTLETIKSGILTIELLVPSSSNLKCPFGLFQALDKDLPLIELPLNAGFEAI